MEVSNVAKLKAVDCLEWMSRQTALADYQEKQSKK